MATEAPPRSLTQAKRLQLLAHDVAMALRQDLQTATDADARTRVARALRDAVSAWDTARDACRVLRNRGLPKAVDGSKKSRDRAFATQAFSETKPE